MRNPFVLHKKNRLLSRLETLKLYYRNRSSKAPLTDPAGPVVSLTTFGPRIPIVYIAIESIGRGTVKPSRLILWLDEAERARELPDSLQRLARRGLDIRYCEDIGPHKKYFPYVQSQPRFDLPLVTADDDVIYPKYWLRELMQAYTAFPDCINCLRAKNVRLEGAALAPYDNWRSCTDTRPSHLHFATGVSGVVYPPAFQQVLKDAGDGFRSVCPRADDIWLHAQALRHGFRVRQARPRAVHFVEVRGTQKSSLNRSNVQGGGNDRQLQAMYDASDLEHLRQELTQ